MIKTTLLITDKLKVNKIKRNGVVEWGRQSVFESSIFAKSI